MVYFEFFLLNLCKKVKPRPQFGAPFVYICKRISHCAVSKT